MTLLHKEKYPMRDQDNKDPDYLAYRDALESGQLDNLAPGTFVVFSGGELILMAIGESKDAVFEVLDRMKIEKCFVRQVNLRKRAVLLPRTVEEAEARRRSRLGPNLPRRR